MQANRIFISYSHRSERAPDTPLWKAELTTALKVFTDHHLIDSWDDEAIPGGYRWFHEIKNAIHQARVAILLLTKDALESEFILEHEFKPLSARDSHQLLVFPILCEACAWESHPFLQQLQIRPFEARPLATCSDTERAATWRRLATEIAEELSRIALSELPGDTAAPAEEHLYLDKFPLTRGPGLREEKLIGREQELALLDLAFAQPHTSIVSLIAWGGVGKTMLVQHWLRRLEREGWFGTQRVYAWSFYSQGTKEDRQASEDLFLAHALQWFGVQCEPRLSPWDKGRLLADAVARERTLLILDGIEPLQYPPGPMGGQLRAPGVQSLLKQLARKSNPGKFETRNSNGKTNCLCLVTTREPLTDLADFQRREGSSWGSVLRVDLGNLTDEAGAALLHHAGARHAGAAEIEPDDKELLAATREVDGHALTLNLLGRFLARAHGGDIRRRDLVKFEEADRTTQGGTTFKMLAAFENWFARSGEFGARQLAVLRILGLFDRPADAGCIGALRKPPAIAGLTRPLFFPKTRFLGITVGWQSLSNEDWNTAVSFLCDFGLIVIQDDFSVPLIDCHPLIREHFARTLQKHFSRGWHAANRRLHEHFCVTTKESLWPSLADIQRLYQAVAHGCRAGLKWEAYNWVYQARIIRWDDYSTTKLGAMGPELGALACFFDTPWSRVSSALTEENKMQALNIAGFLLRALGRLTEAIEPMRAGVEKCLKHKQWREAGKHTKNLSELKLMLGDVAGAMAEAEQAVIYIDRTEDIHRIGCRALLANALCQAGRRTDAEARFREAEVLQGKFEPQYPLLYSSSGYEYCDLLLSEAESTAWKVCLGFSSQAVPIASKPEREIEACRNVSARTARTLWWVTAPASNMGLLTIAVDHLTQGRSALYAAILEHTHSDLSVPCSELELAVSGLSRSGQQYFLIFGLLPRALLRFLKGDADGARADLEEAWDIAERGPMRLHMADIHLYRARLFFCEENYPWESPQADLAAAEKLINECGYHRRDEELADAKRAILGQ